MGSLHLVKGSDEALSSNAVLELVHRLVGDGDRGLMVDELSGDDYVMTAVVDAAQTAPFLTDRRVVVARAIGRFGADDVAPLVAYLGDPLESTDLVLEQAGGRLPKALTDALAKAGATIVDTTAPINKKERGHWFEERLIAAGLNLDTPARHFVAEHLGEDVGRLAAILTTLAATYGTARIGVDQIEPFLGDAGSVAPWDLTDAIDRGDTAGSIEMLHRMLGGGDRHPLQVMATLHAHYQRMLKLDGSNETTEAAAAARLGVKSTFQARKALDQVRRIGTSGLSRAFEWLASADLELRGTKDWPEELVMEVLVARLSRLTRAGATPRR